LKGFGNFGFHEAPDIKALGSILKVILLIYYINERIEKAFFWFRNSHFFISKKLVLNMLHDIYRRIFNIFPNITSLLQKSTFEAAPFLSFGHPSPKGAGRDCGATTSLAPFGGKGLRVRGLK
jgi:hypothetical protein